MFRGFNLTLIFILTSKCLTAQEVLPLNKEINQKIDYQVSIKDANIHTTFKPLLDANICKGLKIDIDSVLFNRVPDYKKRSYFHRKLRYENFVKIDTATFYLTIDPLFNFELGKEKTQNSNSYVNTRGVLAKGFIGEKFYFETSFYENQARHSTYITSFINQYKVIPGQGTARNFGTGGFDYASASALISYSPNEVFNFQFGHGKNFIGDGYRSLLLSDNSFNYPFLKITTNIWKIQYTNLFTQFIDLNETHTYESGYARKYGSFHYLSINMSNRFHLGLFEAVIWQNADSTGTRGMDINYLNPIIFYHPVQYSLGSPDNSIIGLNVKYKILQGVHVFGQLIIDDFNIGQLKNGKGFLQNKYGFQLGARYFNAFKIPGFYLQAEYNQVQPYTYAHKTPMQNYAHYNQALAHPLGANFKEGVYIINYRVKDWFFENKLNYATYGADTSDSHWGKDIFKPDYEAELGILSFNNENGQGVKTSLFYNDLKISYLLNPKTNMNISLGIIYRKCKNEIEIQNTQFFYFSLRTCFTNFYYDF